MKSFQLIRLLSATYPRLLALNALLLLAASAAEAAAVMSLAPLVDFLVATERASMSSVTVWILDVFVAVGIPPTLTSLLILFVGLNVVRSGCFVVAQRELLRTRYVVLRDLMGGVFHDLLHARWFFYTDTKQGTLINTLVREVVVVADAFGSMGQILAMAFQLTLYLVVPLYASWQVTLVCLAAAVAFSVPFVMTGRRGVGLGETTTTAANEMGAVITECLGAAKIIIGFGNHKRAQRMLEEGLRRFCDAIFASQVFAYNRPHVYYPFGMMVFAIAIGTSVSWGVPLSSTAVVLYSLVRIVPSISGLIGQKNMLETAYPSYLQVLTIANKARVMRQPSGERPFPGLEREIVLDNVGFAYPGHPPVLGGLNVRVKKGSLVAFVGESGAGKSTLIDLLMRFHDPTEGVILVDGVPLSELDVDDYRARIGYVPQESLLFNATIRDNLLWANPDASDDEIRQVCRQANATEFIEGLPAGYETVVGDRGVRLSGGQLQRLALARAILRRPDILILDEATSSLDSHSERLIQSAIDEIARDTTIIVVAHRLSTIIRADRIYVLRAASVVEEGNYDELMRRNGVFARMANLQLLTRTDSEVPVA